MFGIDLKKIFITQRSRLNNLAVLLLANVFTAGVGFITTVTIANTFGSARFGELAYALAIGGILAVNVRFGMDRSLIRDLTHYPERFNELLAASLLTRILILALCTFGLLAVMFLPIKGIDISWGMFLIIFATMLTPLQIANVFDIWECQGRHALYNCSQKAIYFFMIWVVVFWNPEHLDLVWIGSALLIATLFSLYLQYHYAWHKIKTTWVTVSFRQITGAISDLLAGNKWLWLASLAALGMTAVNKVVLKHAAGFEDLGVYAASFQLVGIATLLLKNISRLGRPILAKYTIPDSSTARGTTRFLMFYMAAGILAVSIIALPAIAAPKLILEKLFTPEYASGFWVLRILGFYLLFRVFDTILGQYIILIRMDKIFFATLLTAGLLSVACCLILAPPYGATGAAIALLAGEIMMALIYLSTVLFHMKHQSFRT